MTLNVLELSKSLISNAEGGDGSPYFASKRRKSQAIMQEQQRRTSLEMNSNISKEPRRLSLIESRYFSSIFDHDPNYIIRTSDISEKKNEESLKVDSLTDVDSHSGKTDAHSPKEDLEVIQQKQNLL